MASNVLQLRKFAPDSELSEQARNLIDYTLKLSSPKRATKQTIVEAFNETFQLMGGIPRLALWADQNPGQFYGLFSKLLPAQIKAELTLPQSIEGMTPEQIALLPTDQLKIMMLSLAARVATDVQFTEVTETSEDL